MSEPKYTNREDGQLKLIIGKSRYGKTSLLHEIIHGVPRILAWDSQGQIGMNDGFTSVRDLRELAKLLQGTGDKPMKIAFQFGLKEDFDTFAKMAYAWGVQGAGVVLVEEIGDVVSSGSPGRGWGTLVRAGLKYGINLIALTQRPQRVDKDTYDTATEYSIFHVNGMARDWLIKNGGVPESNIPAEKYKYFVMTDGDFTGPFQTKAI